MKRRTKRLLGSLAIAVGALGAAGAYWKGKGLSKRRKKESESVWARPGMRVTFRAELMPGREREERTFRVKELLSNGRVLLDGATGEHAAREFEPLR